ncbi:MAG TPA: OB-fold nucleic acid binding domain-containing protein, partial [Moraxellaceae bacterium]|nr:OB-fold nucleic acid binding domain-containing protein [Moraxellaceae bacterium]
MGKKKPEEMAKERVKFMAGAEEQHIDKDLAGHIFDLMEKFAGYGFNKSHSAAYALVSYQTAWLKVHYPAEFMAAVLSSEMHNTDKIVTFIEECREMKLRIETPDVNHGSFKFVTRDNGNIVYGLGAIKGVGEGPVESVVTARDQDGPFSDLFDFTRRIDLRKCNKRTLEALVRAGALDALGPHRGAIMASLDEAVAAAEQQARNADAGMVDLFGDVVEAAPSGEFVEALPWTDDERLMAEKETLGLYLTGHPIDQYEPELKRFVEQRLADLQPTRRGVTTTVAGLVLSSRIQKGQRGSRAFVLLDDRTGRIEAALFSDTYEQFKHLIVKDTVVVVEGEVSHDDYAGGLKMVVRKVMSLAEARAARSRGLELKLEGARLGQRFAQELHALLTAHRPPSGGGCPVRVRYRALQAEAVLRLGEGWRVQATDELLKRLRQQYGSDAVEVLY